MTTDRQTRALYNAEVSWSGVGWGLAAAFGIAVNALATRVLDVEEAAAFFLAMSVVSGLVIVSQVGLTRVSTRLVSDRVSAGRADQATWVVRRSAVVVSVVAGTLAVLLLLPPGRQALSLLIPSALVPAVVAPIGIAVLLRSLTEVMGDGLRGFSRIRAASLATTTTATGLMAAGLTVVHVSGGGGASVATVLWVLAGGWFLALVATATALSQEAPITAPAVPVADGRMFSSAVAILVVSLTAFGLQQFDLWIAARSLAAEEVAGYGAAARLAQLLGAPLFVVNGAASHRVAGLWSRGDRPGLERLLVRLGRLAGFPGLTAVAVLAVLAEPALSLLFGTPYGAAAPVLTILCVGQGVRLAAGPCGMALSMAGHEGMLMRIAIGSTALMVGAGSYGVGMAGAQGLAWAASATLAIHNVAVWSAVRARLGMRTDIFQRSPAS